MKMGNHIKVWFVIEASFSSLMKIMRASTMNSFMHYIKMDKRYIFRGQNEKERWVDVRFS